MFIYIILKYSLKDAWKFFAEQSVLLLIDDDIESHWW